MPFILIIHLQTLFFSPFWKRSGIPVQWLIIFLLLLVGLLFLTMCIKSSLCRSTIEEERDINHHGRPRTVKCNDDEDTAKPKQVKTHQRLNANLFSVFENVQVQALKEFYHQHLPTQTKEKTLSRCIFFQRTVKVIIVLTFVIVYWVSGLTN